MESQTKTPAINLPPVYSLIGKHEVFPELSHDETARYNFLANLNRHLSTVVAPANKIAFEKRVQPNFIKEVFHTQFCLVTNKNFLQFIPAPFFV